MTVSIEFLASAPEFFLAGVGVLGLMVGSFLNVVIHRLPIMLERTWRQECQMLLALEPAGESDSAAYNLMVPRSHCPACAKPIDAFENIPIVSYLWLRGRCAGCGTRISPRYPVVELLAALLSIAVAWQFGPTWQTGASLLLTWSLIALSFIDLDRQLLPDAITLPVLWIGLLLSLFDVFADSTSSILGAVFGYLSLWSVYHLFRLITGKEGMGYGDFKLLALLGAWLGWGKLPAVILLSSLAGAIIGIAMIVLMQRNHQVPIPFGPYLAIAGWITLMWGDAINTAYLSLANI